MTESLFFIKSRLENDEFLIVKHRKSWEIKEAILYWKFVQENQQTLEFKEKKHKQKIFNDMADFIKTRDTHQCRSHHQKIIKKYKNLGTFIKDFNIRL